MPYQTRMQDAQFRWLLNIFLAILIYVNAEAGRILGIQSLPLNFSAVWPATGFSLTALLLFGYKAWPGIFIGNFCYNILHLYSPHSFGPSITALVITLGSLTQALVGNWVMRRYSTPGYFKTIKDVVIFLLGGGFITCTIAATVGVSAFYLQETLPAASYSFTWLTFWIGDVMGVFVFTPLLIVWSLRKWQIPFRSMRFELLSMIVVLIALIVLFDTVSRYPPVYFFIPFSLWVGYRLGFHGATIAILLIAISTIVITTIGQGWFSHRYPTDGILVLVMFLEILIATALFAAAAENELQEKRV